MIRNRLVLARRRRARTRAGLIAALAGAAVVLFVVTLMVGNTFYGPVDVMRVMLGTDVPGASFAIGDLRLPRATMAVLVGASLGLAGATFQTLLRNPLTAPDIIGISAGAATAAVFGIVVLGLSQSAVAVLSLGAALGTAGAIYLLAHRNGFAGTRLILVGIGIAAMLDSLTLYVLSKASDWDMQAAMQWITGSLNGATWSAVVPLAGACLVLVPVLLTQDRSLRVLRLGDDTAAALGVDVRTSRIALVLGSVALLAFATAAAGPVAFVAFMAGPIAVRIVGGAGSALTPAALVGAVLVLAADLVGQFAFENRLPVGVVTGALGAPFLLFLLARANRTGGTL